LEALAQQAVEMYEAKDWDRIDELVAPGYVRHDPQQPMLVDNRAALKEYLAFLEVAYPTDMEITFDEVLVMDDRFVARFTFSGTNTGPRGDIPATGNRVEITGVSISRVVGGLVVEEWVYADLLGTLQQLGFCITPPQP
jgi:predicted ester cyclase